MNAVFDTNIVIDALNGIPKADAEYARYEQVLISRITWMEVLVGAEGSDSQLRDFLESHFEVVTLDIEVAPPISPAPARCHHLGYRHSA